jgi:octaprenyl-diphosphate synthase
MPNSSEQPRQGHLFHTSVVDGAILHEELKRVEQELHNAISGLYSPLLELAQSQIEQASPLLRAAVVLTASTAGQKSVANNTARIQLAAALEMLYIASNIHKLLSLPNMQEGEDSIEKSVLGSTILVGDYCFSRAAVLAAKSERPQVVEIFSKVLQSISESQLRSLIDPSAILPGEQMLFLQSGVLIAAAFADLSNEETEQSLGYVSALEERLLPGKTTSRRDAFLPAPPPDLRWAWFQRWIESEFFS